ncbi:hypothetical protein ABBQ32_006437 [Trebouxia sp. C0010 RCD-2024]
MVIDVHWFWFLLRQQYASCYRNASHCQAGMDHRRTDWRLRVLTRYGPQAGPTGNEVKAAWAPNDKTVIIIVDPSSPNILAFNTGQAVEQLLRRTFFIELQSRYGNKFFVRDEGRGKVRSGW